MRTDDPAALARAKKRSQAEEKNIKNFLLAAMQRPEGQAFLWDLLNRTHMFHSPFTGDNDVTNFKLGEQNIGLMLTAELIEASETGYIEVLRYGQRRNRDSDRDRGPAPGEQSGEPGSEAYGEPGHEA